MVGTRLVPVGVGLTDERGSASMAQVVTGLELDLSV